MWGTVVLRSSEYSAFLFVAVSRRLHFERRLAVGVFVRGGRVLGWGQPGRRCRVDIGRLLFGGAVWRGRERHRWRRVDGVGVDGLLLGEARVGVCGERRFVSSVVLAPGEVREFRRSGEV